MTYKKYLKSISSDNALVLFNQNLKNYCSLRVGGFAKYIIFINNLKTLKEVISNTKNYMILGAGTNVFFKSKKYNKTIIKLDVDFKKIKIKELKEYFLVEVGTAVNMLVLNNFLKEHGISGLEWSYGIPGTIGGAIIMNAGSFGHEFNEFVVAVKILQDNKSLWVKDFSFGYRTSSFKDSNSIILKCLLKLDKGKSEEISIKQMFFLNERKTTQPYTENSAGSVFKHLYKNGKKYYPAKIIDNLGLKGVRIGGASISKKHAGFIVTKNAKPSDVLKLIKIIKKKVKKKTNLILEEEIIII